MASGTTTTVSIKLLIDTKNNKVLFAEAGKDFVDFLFNLLALPVGSVICLLKKENMVGSLGNLYESVESLSSTYMQPNIDRNSLLKPNNISSSNSTGLPLLLGGGQMSGLKVFRCTYTNSSACRNYVSVGSQLPCPTCHRLMSTEANQVVEEVADAGSASVSSVGYVMGVVTYMVMDDLVVKPMSTISSITMLNKFNVKEVGALEEKVVKLNMTVGLKLLKESLQSATVLTNVFLRNEEEDYWNMESFILKNGIFSKPSKSQRKPARLKEKKNLQPVRLGLRSQDP